MSRKSIKFFIATDVHLGHRENHPVRKNDSFNAFQQVLSISSQENADFLLLGGDLFDQVNPSQKTIYKCLDILQYYVQGQGKKDLYAQWKDHPQYKINFSNQNMSIKLPIFTIHGNHDYPSNDFGKISICDLLHVSNYANYFGKHTNLVQVVIKPMIIEKQGLPIKIAIYGLGYIKDNVLNDLLEKGKVKFQKVQNRQQYFCLFVFHQNRYKKGLRAGAPALKCVSSKHIPQWMDLTIWGHEHQAISKIDIEDDRKIFQPGSTVITSFIQAQSYLKQCLKIEIFSDGQIDIKPMPLIKSYRPMICRNYEIQQLAYNYNKQNQLQFDFYSFLDSELSTILQHVEKQFPSKRPIIRMKIEYTGFEISRCKMLQLKYAQKVANADSILTFWKRKQQKPKNDKQLFQAFKDKTDLNFEQKQITEQILIKYVQSQQNRNLYYDPRQLYTHHHNSILKDTNSPKDYLSTYFTRQLQKKSRPMMKQIDDVYKSTIKQTDGIIKGKVDDILKRLDLDYGQSSSGDDQQQQMKNGSGIYSQAEYLAKRTVRNLWEEQKKGLLIKEDEINSKSLLLNYGENFIDRDNNNNKNNISGNNINTLSFDKKQTNNTSPNKKSRQYSRRSTSSIPSYWVNPQSQKITKQTTNNNNNNNNKNKMQIQEPYQYDEQKPNQNKRQGILKKSFNNNEVSDNGQKQHQHNNEEEDCCKRAERTQYDQGMTKNNFNGAYIMVRNNVDKKVKKNVKQKQKQQITNIQRKKKKSVKWSDSDYQ